MTRIVALSLQVGAATIQKGQFQPQPCFVFFLNMLPVADYSIRREDIVSRQAWECSSRSMQAWEFPIISMQAWEFSILYVSMGVVPHSFYAMYSPMVQATHTLKL
jgi:hypothetical protein